MMTAACGTSAEPPKVAEQIIVRERGAPDAAGPSTGGSQDLVSLGEDVFQTCKGCHSLDADGRSSAGPNLYGVMGRKAGSHEGYSYSDALAASDITWDEASLDGFIADPQGYIPGSEMVVGALRDDERRKAVIAYLAAQGE
ncbi:MAG: c-type cytochrome [Erythrobacter sp.]|uniref:c-type cytochrome n=1 Tax=Erythrobacter sp. TaxID=1042 RepID=UPI003296C5CF